MNAQTTIRPLLPGFILAVGLPVAIRTVLPAEEVGDFAMAGLGLGCAVLSASVYGSGVSQTALEHSKPRGQATNDQPGAVSWPIVAALSLIAAAIYVVFHPAPPDHAGLSIPLLALLTLAPALGIVPYLTLRIGRPFAAVVLAAFMVALTKLAACVVVRIVHGPDSLANGSMSADWQAARLMISLFWIGTVTLSLTLGISARRPGTFRFVRAATT